MDFETEYIRITVLFRLCFVFEWTVGRVILDSNIKTNDRLQIKTAGIFSEY
jgi:hypothetical protein